jgi:hypothetical protein
MWLVVGCRMGGEVGVCVRFPLVRWDVISRWTAVGSFLLALTNAVTPFGRWGVS